MAATVRSPGARSAPIKSTLAHSHTRELQTSSNWRNTCIIVFGRVSISSFSLIRILREAYSAFRFLSIDWIKSTRGATKETADGLSRGKIAAIIDTIRHERYQWKPARRIYIPKKDGRKRPPGIQSWSDNLVQEVVRLILDAYFEPRFSPHSHGFRPERGCHTALREIYPNWMGTVWFIEGDIAKCFGSGRPLGCQMTGL